MTYDMTPKLLMIVAIAAAAGLCFFLVRRFFRRKEGAALPVLPGVLAAGAGAAVVVIALLLVWNYSRDESATEHRQQLAATIAGHAASQPLFNYQQAWTDKYPPRAGTAFPEWVASKELREPLQESLSIAGMEFSFAKTDGQNRLAGFSDLHATSAEATARAWECLRARIDGRVLARCALRAPNEFVPLRTALGAAIAARIGREIDARRTALATTTFEDEVEVAAGLGNAYRAAQCIVCSSEIVDDIARAAAEAAAAEMKALHEKRVQEAKTWASLIGGALFLLLVITSIYLFLNSHTKGYYAWPLRMVAFALYVLAAAAYVLFFKRFTAP